MRVIRVICKKIQAIGRKVFFTSYLNSIGSKINESDLIYTSCALKCHVPFR
jgi:hypothetical protein